MEVGAGRAPGPKGSRGLRETGTRRELVSRLLVESCCEGKEERKARARSPDLKDRRVSSCTGFAAVTGRLEEASRWKL